MLKVNCYLCPKCGSGECVYGYQGIKILEGSKTTTISVTAWCSKCDHKFSYKQEAEWIEDPGLEHQEGV